MASDSLREVGKFINQSRRNADLALKRYEKKLPKKDRARDTVSAVSPFNMYIENEGDQRVVIDINFRNPPPNDCEAECVATACEDFELLGGGHSITVTNPYEAGTVRVFSNGNPLEQIQWYEENPSGGQVYVQIQTTGEVIVVCYTYVTC